MVGDIYLADVLIFATDLIAELLGAQYGCGLETCVYRPIQIQSFVIDRHEPTLHPEVVDGIDAVGLPTAPLVAALRRLLAKQVCCRPEIKIRMETGCMARCRAPEINF